MDVTSIFHFVMTFASMLGAAWAVKKKYDHEKSDPNINEATVSDQSLATFVMYMHITSQLDKMDRKLEELKDDGQRKIKR